MWRRASRQIKRLLAVERTGLHHQAYSSFHATSKMKGKKVIVSDVCQVSDTHRAWLEFQSGNWVGSCHDTPYIELNTGRNCFSLKENRYHGLGALNESSNNANE
ncbi:hypothetical protein L3X38_000506 [Prunus dulcis]|uniref:Uncharacterized protein n=1 Tax=Prunus dulcis TaxID=3755 RepID=A0AAD4ZJ14_PRUDU|nr:hypothetical protein L3X38_000506 [Prunus dulcis]